MSVNRRGSNPAPTDCWYAVVSGSEVGRDLLGMRALDRPVVLFRTGGGEVIALEDRCAHRAYPLSLGTLIDDTVRCGLCGFVFDADGQCVSVPTQSRVPFGAHVDSYPVQESDGLVWIWFGEAGRSRLHRVPELPWLTDTGWATVGGHSVVSASFLLLHESFADVTQIPFVAPEIAPSVLGDQPPPLDVVVTETTVSLHREFAAAVLPQWQATMLGVDAAVEFSTSHDGYFLSPGAWVDHWDVFSDRDDAGRLRFTQLVTPVGLNQSRVLWRVSRDFAIDDMDAGATISDMFESYYGRVVAAMETAQAVLDRDGPGPEVNVSADVAALKVREIVTSMIAEEGTNAGISLGTDVRLS